LVNADDGFHLWSETYERELDDIFAVQEEIARAVTRELRITLLGEEVKAPAPRAGNADAYNAYLQGRYFFLRRTQADLERAIASYQQALALDPGYAAAWTGLAETWTRKADIGYVPTNEGYRTAREAVERALALAPDLAEAHATLGWIRLTYDWDWSGADASYQTALTLEPGNATVVRGAASLASALGRFEEAMALDRRAVDLDPLNVPTLYTLGLHAYYAGRLDVATTALTKALELNPSFPAAHSLLGRVYLAQSRPPAALAEMERESNPGFRAYGLALAYHATGKKAESDAALADLIAKFGDVAAYQVAEVYAYRGQTDEAFEWLERAYTQRDGGLSTMRKSPLLKSLAGDPRQVSFLVKLRLPP
jgi:tetratricopeptide (TPR) repeat protein